MVPQNPILIFKAPMLNPHNNNTRYRLLYKEPLKEPYSNYYGPYSSSSVQRQVAFEDPGGLLASNPQAQGLCNPWGVSQNGAT